MSGINSIKSENQKLREYVSLITAELELSRRVTEIKQNFANPSDSECILQPILNRISKIQSEKIPLEKELNLISC